MDNAKKITAEEAAAYRALARAARRLREAQARARAKIQKGAADAKK
jgi:hypothetical protein